MKNIFISISLSLLLLTVSSAQYTASDSALVRTTYTRQFDKEIINNYLNSGNSRKINAVLLSIANSEDTAWADVITKLDFKKFEKGICFALGELGPCSASNNFLIEKIENGNLSPDGMHNALDAIGKCGNEDSFNKIVYLYFTKGAKRFNGISLSMYNYFIRNSGIKAKIHLILLDELKTYKTLSERNFETLFALSRTEVQPEDKITLSDELKYFIKSGKVKNTIDIKSVTYILSCLRKLQYFPDNRSLAANLLRANDFDVKVAAAQTLVYYKFTNQSQLKQYLLLLEDKNANVGRAAAASLKYLALDEDLKEYLKGYLDYIFKSGHIDFNTEGELFLSYLKIFPTNFEEATDKFEKTITPEYFYTACAYFDSSQAALNYLLKKYETESSKNKIYALQSLLNFQSKFGSNVKLKNLLLNAVGSDYPPLIETAADGIDSVLIQNNNDELKSIIESQVTRYSGNPDFQESMMSLTSLSKKISVELYNWMLDKLSKSDFYSIKKFAYKILDKPLVGISKDTKYFNDFWKAAFNYKSAEITTTKGKFKIKFLPQFAPVSVGSFCCLAEKKFFDNISFHRVVPGFVIQGGDPEGTGWGGPGYDIISEFSYLKYNNGMVGMASAGKDTEGSQWFVTTGCFPHLDGRYTIFAQVIKNLNTVYKISQGDKILSIKLIR